MGYDLMFPEYCKTNNGQQKWLDCLLNLGGHPNRCGQSTHKEKKK